MAQKSETEFSMVTLKTKEFNKRISDLQDDVRRLSAELLEKEGLVSKLMDVACCEHKRLASLSAAYYDTVVWDRSTDPRPSSCSTPKRQFDEEATVCGRKRSLVGVRHDPGLSLSNRYAALATDSPVPPAVAPAAQVLPDLESSLEFPALSRSDPGCPRVPIAGVPRDGSSLDLDGMPPGPVREAPPPSPGPLQSVGATGGSQCRATKSSARRRFLKEAVLRRSGGLPAPTPRAQPPGAVAGAALSGDPPQPDDAPGQQQHGSPPQH